MESARTVNNFLANPVKVFVIDPRNNAIRHVYVYLGDVPKNVRDATSKISDKKLPKDAESALKAFYGGDWKKKLAVEYADEEIHRLPREASGGAEQDVVVSTLDGFTQRDDEIITIGAADDDVVITEEDLPNIQDVIRGRNLTSGMTGIKGMNIDDIEINDDELVVDKKREQRVTVGEDVALRIDMEVGVTYITDTFLFPEDKFSDLKDKVYVSTGIPNYRQHVFWLSSGRMQTPYRIYAEGVYSVDIRASFADISTGHELMGMPIDKNLYVLRDDIKVEALDTFRALGDTLSGDNIVYIVDLDQFIDPNRSQLVDMMNDSYQFDLLYYGFVLKFWPQFTRECFFDYVTNEKELYQKFPDFAKSKTYLRNMHNIEQQIINRNYKTIVKAFEASKSARSPINLAITHMVATTVWEKNIVNLRNLFDKLHVNRCIPEVYAYIDHEGKKFLLRKRFIRNESDITFPPIFKTGLIIAISLRKSDQETFHRKQSAETAESEQSRYLFLNIRANGRYYIKSIWNEEDEYGFDEILSIMRKIADPIIEQVNTMGKYVFPTDKPLPKLTKNNVQYDNLSISVYWKKILSSSMFKFVKTLFEEYIYGGIVGVKGLQQMGQFELVFRKGMTEFDPGQIERVISMANIETISNHYAYLSNNTVKQKWDQLYDGRVVRLHHRTTDLKFEIINIKEREFQILYSYLLVFIFRAMCNDKLKSFSAKPASDVKKLRKLKEIDPELYNLKKYGSKKVYSIICQNPNQPVVYTEDEIRDMSVADRKKLVKYWNFTLNRDAFYGCPNKKYPHLSFKVGVHPKGYCLPCCKKSESSIDSKKARINEICLRKHVWTDDLAEEEAGLSRHVINYGKDVDTGRLSKLPPSSLSQLVANTLEETHHGYYLYGVPQHYPGLEYAGLVYSIAESLEMPTADFIKRCVSEIAKRGMYQMLMNGALVEYFQSEKEFVATLTDIFIDMKPIVLSHRFTQWDDLFSELAVLIFNLYVYIFVDDNGKGEYTYLYVNERTRQLVIQSADPDARYMLAVKRVATTYPVFVINIDTYFKNLHVARRTFSAKDTVVKHLNSLINTDNDKSSISKTGRNIDLQIIREFTSSASHVIAHKYVNNRNLCYAVLLKVGESNVYVPIEYVVNIADGTPEVHTAYSAAEHPVKLSALQSFASQFNEYITNRQRNYMQLVFRFAVYVDGKLNHLRGEGHTVYYVNEEDVSQTLSRLDAKYDYSAINASIMARRPPVEDNRNKMLGRSLYDNYLYQLFMLEFINYTEKERNVELRKQIREVLTKVDFRKKVFEAQRELRTLLKQYPADTATLQAQIAWAFHNSDKKGLLETIDSTVYEFDKMTINRLRKMERDPMRVELKRIASEFTTDGQLDDKKLDVPNIYLPCEYTANVEYCKGKRLVMTPDMLGAYVDILASDLTNPIKYKYLTSGLFTDNIIDYFKFEQHAGEVITITKL